MTKPFDYPDQPMDRGKVLSARDVDRLGGFARYKDVDGGGGGWGHPPGTDHPLAAYFTRGTGHNERAGYSERPDDWEKNMARLARKLETARRLVPRPVEDRVAGAEVALIGFGSAGPAIEEARVRLKKKGLATSYLALRAVRLADAVKHFVAAHPRVYVVELNTDAQMCQLLRLHAPEHATRLIPCNDSD